MKKRIWLVLMLAFLVILVGCGTARNGVMQEMGASSRDYDDAYKESRVPGEGYERAYDESAVPGEHASGEWKAKANQKLVYNAGLVIETEDITAANGDITRIARQSGGFVAKSYLYRTEKKRTAELLLRIPADQLFAVLEELRSLGNVKRDTLDSDDVTMRYIDLEARNRNLQRQEERLLDVLDRAETIEDVLQVEKELARVRGDVEAYTAEFRYLRDRIDYASVSVSLEETYTASTMVKATGLKGVWRRGINGLVSSVNALLTGLGDFIVFVFKVLPFLLLLLVIAAVAYLIFRKRKSSRDVEG